MSAIEQIMVGEKTYKVQKLSVLDTIYFHAEAMHYLGDVIGRFLDIYVQMQKGKELDLAEAGKALTLIDPLAIRALQPKILKQVVTPENEFLDNEMKIEGWFSRPENSGDVWDVTVKAGSVLLGEYLPRFLKKMVGTMKTTATESLSQKNTEPKL
jgi:hypothetical protein